MHLTFLYPAIALLLLSPAQAAKPKLPKDAILLSNVKTLTLRANKLTSHRRVSAIPQLTCSGPGCAHHKVELMRCINAGADYNEEDIQWTCTADLPEEFKLGATDVVCEGYADAGDERVLKGSCGVSYRLLLTEKGEERFGSTWWGGSKSKSTGTPGEKTFSSTSGLGEVESGALLPKVLFGVIFLAIAFWILSSMFAAVRDPTPRRRPRQPRTGPGFGGGGGGGPFDDDDPPPPYSSYPGKRSYGSSTRQSEAWRPGFWSGTAAGAAAGYMAGRNGAGSRAQARPARNTGGGGWFGGGGGGGGGSSSGGASGSSGSSATYESTGFGSTSRR